MPKFSQDFYFIAANCFLINNCLKLNNNGFIVQVILFGPVWSSVHDYSMSYEIQIYIRC